MVSGLRNSYSSAYTQDVGSEVIIQPDVSPAEVSVVKESAPADGFEGGVQTTGVTTESVAARGALSTPDSTHATSTKKQSKLAKTWDGWMKSLQKPCKTEIKQTIEQNFKFDEAEKYKLDLKVDLDLTVDDAGKTVDQKAFFANNKGALLIGSKVSIDLKASATTPVDYVKSGELVGGISIDSELPVAIDPAKNYTKQDAILMWDRTKAIFTAPYTAKTCKNLPQGAQISVSYTVGGGVAIGDDDNSAEVNRRTKVTLTVVKGEGDKLQLMVVRQRVDQHAIDLTTGDLSETFSAEYNRKSQLDRTTVAVYDLDLSDDKQMAALQKALPWTVAGGKCKWLPGSDESAIKSFENKDKAENIRKREFSDVLDLKGDGDNIAGEIKTNRKYEDGKFTVGSLVKLQIKQEGQTDKGAVASRSNTLVLPDKEAKLTLRQLDVTAHRLNQFNTEAWRTTPEGTKLTSLVTTSLAITKSDNLFENSTGQHSWQLDPSGKNAITVEVVQTAAGPVVSVIEENKLELLAQLKSTNIDGSALSSQVKDFGVYEAIEDFLQNDGKNLKTKYPAQYETIKEELSALVSEQLSYNMRLSAGVGREGTNKVSFGPFGLSDPKQKAAFTALTGNLDLKDAIDLGLMQQVNTGSKTTGNGGVDINNHELATTGGWDKKREVKVEREGSILTLTVTDTKVRDKGISGASNNIFSDLDESDISYSGGITKSKTEVKVYVLDLNKPEHQAAWQAAVSAKNKDATDFELNFSEIDKLNVRDASKEKIITNKIYTSKIDAAVEKGPIGTTIQVSHDYKDKKHTVGSMVGFSANAFYKEEDDDSKKLTGGLSGSSTLVLPDEKAELSNRKVQLINSSLSNLDIESWKNTPVGTKLETTFGTTLSAKYGDDFGADDANKSQPWSIDLSGKYLSTVKIEQTAKGAVVTLVQTKKADVLAAFKSTKATDMSISADLESYGLYNALEDYLQNGGAKLLEKFGETKYAAISEELKTLVEEQQARNIGIKANLGREKALSTSFGPFDLSKEEDIALFTAAGQGNMKPALDAGRIASVSTKKITDAGATVDKDSVEFSLKSNWEKEHTIEFQRGENGRVTLVVTEKKLLDNKTGSKLPDLTESISVTLNTEIKTNSTKVTVYELDLNKPEHQAALQSCLSKVNDHKAPEKALTAIDALNVRNKEKEKIFNESDVKANLGLLKKDNTFGSTLTVAREHKDGKYSFSNLLSVKKDWKTDDLALASFVNASFGVSVNATRKMDIVVPDGDGKINMNDAQSAALKIGLNTDDAWVAAPVGTSRTQVVNGSFSATAGVNAGKEISLMDGLTLGAKAGVSLTPTKGKIMGNTVTMTENGPVVTVWQEDIGTLAFNLELDVGLTAKMSDMSPYQLVEEWVNNRDGLLKKFGPDGLKAADKAINAAIAKYCKISMGAELSYSRSHKETATFGPFNVENESQKAAFDKLVHFFYAKDALEAGLLQTKQVDETKTKIAKGNIKISVLEMATEGKLAVTNSAFDVNVGGEKYKFAAYDSKYTKTGKNGFRGENFTYVWDAFAVNKLTDGNPEQVDVVFQGSFEISDKHSKAKEVANWQNFSKSLGLDVSVDEVTGKHKLLDGYGKGDGKIVFGCSISAFTDSMKNWQPLDCYQTYLETSSRFTGKTIPPTESASVMTAAVPFDSNAVELGLKYLMTTNKKNKAAQEAVFKQMYPNAKVSLPEMAKLCNILQKYYTSYSEKTKAALMQEFTNIYPGPGSATAASKMFQASFLIYRYRNGQEDKDRQNRYGWESQYQKLTHGRNLRDDTELIEEAHLFMTRMNEIHDDWQKMGGENSSEAMKEVIDGICGYGKKSRPWNIRGANRDSGFFMDMAVFLNLVGKDNQAVKVSYNAKRFHLAAEGKSEITNTDPTGVVEAQRQKYEKTTKAIGSK